jgi:hypothetical protein
MGPVRPDGTPIDKEAVRQKYLAERDKRLRPDGNDQYLRLTGGWRTTSRPRTRPGPSGSRRTTT